MGIGEHGMKQVSAGHLHAHSADCNGCAAVLLRCKLCAVPLNHAGYLDSPSSVRFNYVWNLNGVLVGIVLATPAPNLSLFVNCI